MRERGYFRQSYKLALRVLPRVKNRDKQSLLILLGDVSRQRDLFDEARHWYQKAQAGSDSKLKQDARMGEALCWRAMGQYKKCLKQFQILNRSYRREKDLEGFAFCLWAAGTTYRFMGELVKAEKFLMQSIRLYQKLKDNQGWAYSMAGLGGTLRMAGRYRESGLCYKKAYDVFIKCRDEFGVAYSCCGRGNALRMMGFYKEGLKFSRKAEASYRHRRQDSALGFVLWSQAQTYIMENQKKEAKRKLLEAARLFKKAQDDRGQIYVLLGWGEYYRHFAMTDKKSNQFYRQALKLSLSHGLKLETKHARARLKKKPYLSVLP